MKAYSAKATFTKFAERLFANRATARKVVQQILSRGADFNRQASSPGFPPSESTPQSAPVDGESVAEYRGAQRLAMLLRNHRNYLVRYAALFPEGSCMAAEIDRMIELANSLTTPPPASQERGGDSIVLDAYQLRVAAEFAAPDYEQDEDQRGTELIFQSLPERIIEGETLPSGMYCWYADYPEEGVMHLEEYEEYEARMTKVASPPSSAAEAKEPEQRCPYCAGRIYSAAGCQNCKVGSVWPKPVAAEQAKPDDNMQLRARVAGELIAARDTEDGCNRIMALIATLDTYTAQTECVAAMYPAEQAQAGELQEEIQWALNGLPQLAINLRFEGQTSRADTVERIIVILRRLAGGLTVDDAMVERALDAREQHTGTMVRDHLSRGRMHINEWNNGRSVIRASLIAALGAK